MFNVFRASRLFSRAEQLVARQRNAEALPIALEAWRILGGIKSRWGYMSSGRLTLVVTVSRLVDELGVRLGCEHAMVPLVKESRALVVDASTAVPEFASVQFVRDHISWADCRLEELSHRGGPG